MILHSELELANVSKNAGGNPNGFLANLNLQGVGSGFREIDSSGTVSIRSLSTDSSGNIFLSGFQYSGLVSYGNGISVTGSAEQWMLL